MADLTAVIPCFNGASLVGEAIDSVLQQNAQVDVIVVDDGSTDSTGSVARATGAQVVRHETNRGVAAAVNSGVLAAETDLVMVLDFDDLLEEGAASALVKAARRFPEASAFLPDVELVDFHTARHIHLFQMRDPILDVHRLLALDQIPQSCGRVYRREVFLAHPYRAVIVNGRASLGSEDWQHWTELALAGFRAVSVPEARGIYRRREGSVSMNTSRKWRTGCAILNDERLRHPGCADCVAAVEAGKEALRSYCFSMDVAQLQRGAGLGYALRIAKRDPHLTLRALHAFTWATRDRLLGR